MPMVYERGDQYTISMGSPLASRGGFAGSVCSES